jgi:putative protease
VSEFKKPELLAPVGDFAMLRAAIQGGCNAIYFGIRGLNMRVRATNFSIRDLPEIVRICHENQIHAYLALNTIIYENELSQVKHVLKKASESHVHAIIAWDLAVLRYACEFQLPVHLSTQASASNSAAIEMYETLGVSRLVLARECSLEHIRKIKSKVSAEIEVFIHGAMCVSESGRCFISQFLHGKSANRGECIQPCRREYKVIDKKSNEKLILGQDYVLSPKDLCTLPFIDKLIEAQIDAFKIEGRARSPEYVKTVVECYRQAIDAWFENKLSDEYKAELLQRLKTVYHRNFSDGFFLAKPINEWAGSAGSLATTRKEFLGVVQNYYKKAAVADILLQAGKLEISETLLIIGPTTGVQEFIVNSIQNHQHEPVKQANQGDLVGIKMSKLVRRNDKVYKLIQLK